jgi:hypothetical protein
MNISYWLPLLVGRSRRSEQAMNGVCAFRFSRNFFSNVTHEGSAVQTFLLNSYGYSSRMVGLSHHVMPYLL